MFYFDTGNFRIFGSSPEAQLKITKGTTEIHPIAGTYKRTGDDAFDIVKSAELLNDAKENAEHHRTDRQRQRILEALPQKILGAGQRREIEVHQWPPEI